MTDSLGMSLQGLGAQGQAAAGRLDSQMPAAVTEDHPNACQAHQSGNTDDLEPPARYATGMLPCPERCIESTSAASG